MADVDEQYHGWFQDSDVIRYINAARRDRSMKSLREFAQSNITDPNRHFFKIMMRDTERKVGTISLNVDERHQTASFAYLIGDHDHWGGDVALQAQVGVFDHAFRSLGLRKVHGSAAIVNIGSNFNFRRLGFIQEGIRRAHILIGTDGEKVSDLVDYGCLAEEWLERSADFDHLRWTEND